MVDDISMSSPFFKSSYFHQWFSFLEYTVQCLQEPVAMGQMLSESTVDKMYGGVQLCIDLILWAKRDQTAAQ